MVKLGNLFMRNSDSLLKNTNSYQHVPRADVDTKNTISMVESCQTWDERTRSHLVSKNLGLLQIWSTKIPLVSIKKQTSQYENLPNVGFSSDIQTAAANPCQVGYSTYNIYVCASFFGV